MLLLVGSSGSGPHFHLHLDAEDSTSTYSTDLDFEKYLRPATEPSEHINYNGSYWTSLDYLPPNLQLPDPPYSFSNSKERLHTSTSTQVHHPQNPAITPYTLRRTPHTPWYWTWPFLSAWESYNNHGECGHCRPFGAPSKIYANHKRSPRNFLRPG